MRTTLDLIIRYVLPTLGWLYVLGGVTLWVLVFVGVQHAAVTATTASLYLTGGCLFLALAECRRLEAEHAAERARRLEAEDDVDRLVRSIRTFTQRLGDAHADPATGAQR